MKARQLVIAIVITIAFASCAKRGPDHAPPQAPPPSTKLTERPVRLYYEGDSQQLVPVEAKVALPDDDAGRIRPLLDTLIVPAPEGAEPKPVPSGLEIRATYFLPDGTAIVDLGGPLLAEGWKTGSDAELMLVYSIVHTLTSNLPSVRQVQLLVNGRPAETLAGHVSIERPLQPIASLVQIE